MSQRATGIVWVGPIFHAGGYGSVSRNYVLGLQQIGVPIRVVNLGPDDRDVLDPDLVRRLEALKAGDPGLRPVGVVHREPDAFPAAKLQGLPYRIGCTIFETDRIPRRWVGLCNRMDEIWVPSRFNDETFSRSGVRPGKIRVIPYSVDTEFFHPTQETYPIEGKRGFVFLYVAFFDWRKGFDVLLEAYSQEFRNSDDVSLIIKSSEPDHLRGHLGELHRLIDRIRMRPAAPHVVVITERLNQAQLRQLYHTCDLYLSTDRANGWGIPCMEAMAVGKPAATIDWSGSTEFMTSQNSLLIRPTGRLVPVDQRLARTRPIYRGHRWAEVTVHEVQRTMRYAYEHQEALAAIAKKGLEDMRSRFALVPVAEQIHARLDAIELPRADGLVFLSRVADRLSGRPPSGPRMTPVGQSLPQDPGRLGS